MREIKFRAWDLDFKKMWLPHDSCHEYLKHENQQASITGFMMSDSCHLMQYTGLKDKNGVEIYENDILSKTYQGILGDKTETFLRSAMWDKNNACFILSNDKNCLKTIKFQADGWEVIGNIYENPELLKNKAE